MKFYENVIVMRHAHKKPEINHYDVHAFIEKKLVETHGIHTPYSFSFIYDEHQNTCFIKVRSSESLSLPGEKITTLALKENDVSSFLVTLYATKKTTGKNKEIPLECDEDKIKKLHNIQQKNGYEVIEASHIDDIKLHLRKGKKRAFSLAGATLKAKVKILDAKLFEKAIVEGLGRKRNFGLGQLNFVEVNANAI